jgi:EAL domain-containing protein (putative c-di-GMP-specific phosphodiesterase class I)
MQRRRERGEGEMYHSDIKALSGIRKLDIDEMIENYRFSEKDAITLKPLKPLMQEALDTLIPGFYDFIFSFEHAKIFLNNPEILQKHEAGIRAWFLDLFSGTYDAAYFQKLITISEIHVKIGLPPHYVNTAFSYIRQFLDRYLSDCGHREALASVHKIIDINLDILSLSYQEEEQQQLINTVVLLKRVSAAESVIPFVQPIVDTHSGEIVKFECLMRLEDPDTKECYSIFPVLQTAKSIKIYEQFARLMVIRSLEIFRKLPWQFSLNLGYDDISNPEFIHFLYAQIEAFPDPKRIMFELLESDFIDDFSIVSDFVTTVRSYGCQIAIDDFGSGYSNMKNILKLQPEYIKIDGSLIREINTSETSLTVVSSVIAMAHELQAKTIAEHIHNKQVYEIIKTLKADYMQGYYTGRPFDAKKLLEPTD